jgi:hypothetical protein
MAKVRIELTRSGPRQLRQLPAVQAEMARRAQKIAAAAGPGMEATSMVGRTRARASVITATGEARRNEATSRSLTRAIDAGRG